MLKVSDFLKWDINAFVIGAFLSRFIKIERDGKTYFYTYSDLRRSKYLNDDRFDFDYCVENNCINDLNSQSRPKGINLTYQKNIMVIKNLKQHGHD